MGSKGGAPSPPLMPSSSPSVVCCMCGDHGLQRDLFRCKVCLVRSQHNYCSNLYPKAGSYRACNWCLREEGGKQGEHAGVDPMINSLSNSLSDNNSSTNGGGGGGSGGGLGLKLHRAAFPSHLNKPVKKPRQLERSASDVIDRMRSEELSPVSARGRQVLRGKVRRYKLLEEVSS